MLIELLSRSVAGLMLIVLFPIFIIISLCSLIFQGNPVFFRQERVGFRFQPFILVKFRTMKNNSPGTLITSKGDDRITSWGKFLRVLKFDEIPQLWNIVKGDMRFIGPRPEVLEYIKKADFSFIQKVKPGISDFSSILLRNEEKILNKMGSNNAYEKLLPIKVRLAHLYADHKGIFMDLLLVTLTVISIISPKTSQRLIVNLFIKRFDPKLIPAIQEILI